MIVRRMAAAHLLDIEPEKERWRNNAQDWYGAGLSEQSGTGKFHHHLGLLSREVRVGGMYQKVCLNFRTGLNGTNSLALFLVQS
jgi:hypothetical protein